MMKDQKLICVTVVTDDDTGMYDVGEMDFSVPWSTQAWLDREGNRAKLADWLAELSRLCRDSAPPFTGEEVR